MGNQQSFAKHLRRLDVNGQGYEEEIVVIKEDLSRGDLYFIKVNSLDEVDKARIRQLLNKPNAHQLPMWDLMSQQTLKNGEQALEYFHQLVQVRTSAGEVFKADISRRGASRRPVQAPAPKQETKSE